MLFAKFIWMLSSLRARMRLSKSIMHLQPRVSREHQGSFVMTSVHNANQETALLCHDRRVRR